MTQKRARSQEAIEQRYKDILSAARKLFLVKSYDQISLVSLAKQLDISRPSFYTYFPSKDALFLQLLKEEGLKFADASLHHFKEAKELPLFCQELIALVVEHPLFIKLLSIPFTSIQCHQTDEEAMQLQIEVVPFFESLAFIFQQQFPSANQVDILKAVHQFYLLITTISNFGFFAQIYQEKNLDFFGPISSADTVSFYSDMLYKMVRDL
ncbi:MULTISPECIES: TetR/AcrR family transcriptional regulator [unclassified Streptococcus]|uniref:TetR/AcrR family transcriptional regulator n=1 Tax=unclassified Streptococcus TaxID=2608887 RepID=UPI0018A8CBEF|nr:MULTISPECIES: TetR/AcrR family transcriptional regulator [unclassified Streptococcus]MBF8969369.1 TetR/AcrR family transcriptional regulator [Streptococcus sp. NLN76]MBG9366790.1 TetR/AcrR family transcriptional regulator [Streptococcus sp. NLN64]MBJ6745653.1 TetR/AcrR family transcriptional regulator [Streptococcus sp. 121]